jgi:hypothetical protein
VDGSGIRIIRSVHVPALLEALVRWPGEDGLDVLRRYASSERSRVFEKALALGVVPVEARTLP